MQVLDEQVLVFHQKPGFAGENLQMDGLNVRRQHIALQQFAPGITQALPGQGGAGGQIDDHRFDLQGVHRQQDAFQHLVGHAFQQQEVGGGVR